MKKLKEVRESKIGFNDFKEKAGMGGTQISKIENESGDVKIKTIDKYLATLGIDGVYDHINRSLEKNQKKQ